MNIFLTLLIITLVIAAISTGISYGASLDSTLYQLQNGILPEDIQCQNSNHILAQRDNGSPACVTMASALKLGWNIIESDISRINYEFPLSAKTTKTNFDGESGVWLADFDVTISNLPKIGETADIVVTVTNESPYHVNELYPDAVIGIDITDNFEFVNIPTEQIRKNDKYGDLFYGEHLTVDINGTQTLSATVKAVKSGMGNLGGIASNEYSYKPRVFVGEDQTLLRDDYYKLNPDKDPSNNPVIEEKCTNEWCEPEPLPPDELTEEDHRADLAESKIVTDEEFIKSVDSYAGYPKLTDDRYQFYDNIGFVYLEEGHQSIHTLVYNEDPENPNELVLDLVATFGKVYFIIPPEDLISIKTDKREYDHGEMIQIKGHVSEMVEEDSCIQHLTVSVTSNNHPDFRESLSVKVDPDCNYNEIIDTSGSTWFYEDIYTITIESYSVRAVIASTEIELISAYVHPQRTSTPNDLIINLSSPVEFVDDGREFDYVLQRMPAPRLVYDTIMEDMNDGVSVDSNGVATITSQPHEKYSINPGVGIYGEDWMPNYIPDGYKLLSTGSECYEIIVDCGLGIWFVPTTFELVHF